MLCLEEEKVEETTEEMMNGMNAREKRLFKIRMRLNKGRVANRTAVVEEHKKMTDPKYEQKQRQKQW